MNALRNIPLQDVMALCGHQPVRRHKNNLYYNCPMPQHKDEDASFVCEASPSQEGGAGAAFNCFGCHQIHGAGAIQLLAQLWGIEPKGKGFYKIVEKLSCEFHIEIQGVENPHDHYVKVDPVSEFQWERTKWTDAHLRALGCKVEPQYREADNDEPEDATGRMVYSWGMVGEPGMRVPGEFDPEDITRRFGVEPIASFTTPSMVRSGNQSLDADTALEEATSEQRTFSLLMRATDYYPMFVIKTVDGKGRWRVKKYEPYNRPDNKGRSFKWTWWYQNNEKGRNTEYKHALYGDCDVLDALYHKDIVPMDTSMNHDHPVIDVTGYGKNGLPESTRKFKRVVLCSGPRDAMQVFYHSDCHVVYPHSETADIDPRLLTRLFEIADQVFVLFDQDKTGIKEATDLNLEYLQLRNIELPEDMALLTDSRTGKPVKDVSGYFEYYPAKLRAGQYRRKGIDAHFNDLLSRSIPLQFWKRTRVQSNSEKPLGKCHYNYALDDDSMKRFLHYSGMAKIRVSDRLFRFVLIKDNIVETIPDKMVVPTARGLMKDWLMSHPMFYDPDLSTRITTSRNMLSQDTLHDLPAVELNFKHWGAQWDYIFFKNGALLVTPERRELKDYATLPFHVNKDAILPHVYVEMPDTFRISLNPALEEYERKHRERLDMIPVDDLRAVEAENMEWQRIKTLYSYRLELLRPMNEQPSVFQYIYDLGRMYWREEEAARREGKPAGQRLSPDRQQFEDMQFINKAGGLGFIMSRHRTPSMSRMAYIVDYNVMDEMKATGRTGKSILGTLMKCVRNQYAISGKDFKANPEMTARNFRDYDYLKHDYININDLRSSTESELFYNWAEGEIVKKNLNQDEQDIPRDMAAKFLISSNKMFDLSAPSTRGRLWLMLVGDYYHETDGKGLEKWDPAMKFRYNLGVEDTPEQFNYTVNLFVRFLQFYLGQRTYIEPPVSTAGRKRQLYARFSSSKFDRRFLEWADMLFANKALMGQPLPKIDLVVSWFQFTGRDVTRESVLAYARGQNFGQMLSAYCSEMRIISNPDICFGRQSDKKRRLPRVPAWTYEFHPQTGRLTGRRFFDKEILQSCYYFYPIGEEPKDENRVGQQTKERDIAVDGYILEMN